MFISQYQIVMYEQCQINTIEMYSTRLLDNKLKVTWNSNVVFDHVSFSACIPLSLDVGSVVKPIIC